MRLAEEIKKLLKRLFPLSLQDTVYCILIVGAFSALTFLLQLFHLDNQVYAVMIFFLGVVLVSRLTDGYFYGIISAFIFMLEVNYFFTYPYMAFNFTISGYPLTFFVMLLIAVVISAMTTQIKQQEKIRMETETEKMRGNLLRSVSHDLRTPLTSIIGSTAAVMDNDEKLSHEDRMVLLGDVRDEANWLLRVVENILSITRMGGTAKISKEEEAAEEVVSEAVQKFRRRYPGANVKVRVPNTLLFVPMDAVLIEQVLINLMENAVKHAVNMTQIEVTVTQDGENASFSVSDDGEGIPKELLPVVFDGMIHSEETDSASRNMGIGLSVCKAIVIAHQGKITAKNMKKGGAQFTFTLPLEEENYENPGESADR